MLRKIMEFFSSRDEPVEIKRTGFVSFKPENVRDTIPERYLDIWEKGEREFCFPETFSDSFEEIPALDYTLIFSRKNDALYPIISNHIMLYGKQYNDTVCTGEAVTFLDFTIMWNPERNIINIFYCGVLVAEYQYSDRRDTFLLDEIDSEFMPYVHYLEWYLKEYVVKEILEAEKNHVQWKEEQSKKKAQLKKERVMQAFREMKCQNKN